MTQFIRLDENGLVLSTLITASPEKLDENHGLIEVDDVSEYIGKRVVNGEIVAVEPPPKTILTHHEFRTRFTFEEKVAIQSATDPGVKVVQADFDAADQIDLENADLIAGMEYLVSQELLTADRKTEILAY